MVPKPLIARLFHLRIPGPPEPIQSGLYHYMCEAEGTYTRFHLRVELDGSGMLLANATAAARLSPAGVVMAKSLLEEESEGAIERDLLARFRGVSRQVMRGDLERVKDLIDDLAAPGDNYPIINLEDAALSPSETQLMAPLRADVPLVEPERLVPIIDRLWDVGVPHVTFLAPGNPNAEHLVRAVERAEDTGMIAGIRGRGSSLGKGTLVKDLALAGVDHVTVLYASTQRDIHDSLCGEGDQAAAKWVMAAAHEYEVCPVAEIPLVEATLDTVDEALAELWDSGVTNISFFAIAVANEASPEERDGAIPASAMPQVAALVEGTAHQVRVRHLWQPPVLRNPQKPLATQVREGPRCSGDVAVRVEPDGAVIPPRGPYQSAGNLLKDPWATIWEHPAFRIYRERIEAPTRCNVCPGLAICAADCPREPAGWSHDVPGGETW
jgi:radical SAM protein with 4Fe4S-binding SPASM domain